MVQNCAESGERSSWATAVFAASKYHRLCEQLKRETASTQMVTCRISFTCPCCINFASASERSLGKHEQQTAYFVTNVDCEACQTANSVGGSALMEATRMSRYCRSLWSRIHGDRQPPSASRPRRPGPALRAGGLR